MTFDCFLADRTCLLSKSIVAKLADSQVQTRPKDHVLCIFDANDAFVVVSKVLAELKGFLHFLELFVLLVARVHLCESSSDSANEHYT